MPTMWHVYFYREVPALQWREEEMKLRYYLLSDLICIFGGIYFAFWQNGNPIAIFCFIASVIIFTIAQAKQMTPEGITK